MQFAELVRSRRTVHDFADEPIPRAWLDEALALAVWAPNHKLTLPWAYYEFNSEQKTRWAEWAVEMKIAKKPLLAADENFRARERQKWLAIPHVFWLLQRVSAGQDSQRHREDFAAVACAVQNITLALWQHGVASKWSTGKITTEPRLYELAGLSAADYENCGFLLIGYPAAVPEVMGRKLNASGQLFTAVRV
jgi:nitroreductase